MDGELHPVGGPEQREYYELVLQRLNYCIQQGHPFALHTEAEDGRTFVTFAFESEALAPYMAHLDGSPMLWQHPSTNPAEPTLIRRPRLLREERSEAV